MGTGQAGASLPLLVTLLTASSGPPLTTQPWRPQTSAPGSAEGQAHSTGCSVSPGGKALDVTSSPRGILALMCCVALGQMFFREQTRLWLPLPSWGRGCPGCLFPVSWCWLGQQNVLWKQPVLLCDFCPSQCPFLGICGFHCLPLAGHGD